MKIVRIGCRVVFQIDKSLWVSNSLRSELKVA